LYSENLLSERQMNSLQIMLIIARIDHSLNTF